MGTIAQEDYTRSLFTLLKETFEGPPPQTASAYLDQGAGLFQTIDNLTAEEVSRVTTPGAPTIAAHCAHARFYVSVLQQYMQGHSEKVDWNESWLVQTVNASQWAALKKELRQSYETLMEALKAVESWGDEQVGGGMAIITHTAYHLGAIRQLMRLLK
ncbi:MAG TPA: hypothetical protein VGC66_13155 [Pyrinomonadaceae bacterium]|jgi:hypothetical protein